MRGSTHRTRALEFEIHDMTAVGNPIFKGCHSLKMFVVHF